MKKTFKEILFRQRFRDLHKKSLAHYIDKSRNTPRVTCADKVIVTFTTIPERIEHIDVMLKSLLDQSVLPDKIYLCIPAISRLTQTAYVIPEWLSKISLLEIVQSEKDFGPITKLIPSWQRERHAPDTRLIVVDDDVLYPSNLIESLVRWSDKFPQVALGCSGVMVPSGFLPSEVLTSEDSTLINLRYTPASSNALQKVSYLFGYAGLILRTRFLQDNVLDYADAPKGAFFEDDLWIGAHLALTKTDRCVIPSAAERLMPGSNKKTLQTRALCLTDNQGGKNMDDTYRHFSHVF